VIEPVRRCIAALLVVLAPAVAVAGPVETRIERVGSGLDVHSTLEASAPATTCYATLADLEHLAQFVPGLESSRIVSAPGAPIELHQVGETRAFGMKLDVTFAVRLDPPRQIEFRRIRGNFVRMEGSWTVSGNDAGCRIEYRAAVEPDFWVPPLLGPMLMRREVDAQMAGVLAEISRRAKPAP
jgi:ribosome-associated toxin RatA of RatAB toxin-antitoxin module